MKHDFTWSHVFENWFSLEIVFRKQNFIKAYVAVWFHQDKLILSAIISSLTEGVLTHVVGVQTSREVSVRSPRELATMKKGSLFVADYLNHKAQNMSHILTSVGLLKDWKFISYVLGLNSWI